MKKLIRHIIYKSNIKIFSLGLLFFLILVPNIYPDDDIEVTGSISELGNNFIIVDNIKFYIDGNTEFKSDGDNYFSFSSLNINDVVSVRGNQITNDYYLATRIELKDHTDNESEFEFTGFITSIDNSSITVNGYTFLIDPGTQLEDRNETPVNFDLLKIGDLVEIKAKVNSSGILVASRIKIENDNNHNEEIEITGTITSLGSNTIMIGNIIFIVNSNTQILGDDNLLISFNDLKLNEKVEIKALRQSDNSYLALKIIKENGNENEITVTGQIKKINGSVITVNGIDFLTDSNTVFLDNNRMESSFNKLTVGMLVEITAYKLSDSDYYATVVKAEDLFREEFEIKGFINIKLDSSIVVAGISIKVDSSTVILDRFNNPVNFSELQGGDFVEVHGIKNNRNELIAVRISIEGLGDIDIIGKITAVFNNYFELNNIKIFVSSSTLFLNPRDQLITYDQIRADQTVEVKFIRQSDGSFYAVSIKIEDASYYSKITGPLSFINNSNLEMSFSKFLINSETVVIDKNFKFISPARIIPGDIVTVWSDASIPSVNTVLQIQVNSPAVTGIADNAKVIKNYELRQNYPNPFNPSTTISFTIPSDQFVTLKVFNLIGQEVKTLIKGNMRAGDYKIRFDASFLGSGVYFYKISTKNFVNVKKMILVK